MFSSVDSDEPTLSPALIRCTSFYKQNNFKKMSYKTHFQIRFSYIWKVRRDSLLQSSLDGMFAFDLLTKISMHPLVILVGICRAWKKEVFSGPRVVAWAGTWTSRGARAPALAGALTWYHKQLLYSTYCRQTHIYLHNKEILNNKVDWKTHREFFKMIINPYYLIGHQ